MRQRGRKSSASLAIIPRDDDRRPPPPDDLTKEQRLEWQRIVTALPAGWFAPENETLLAEYCRHTCRARELDRQIEQALSGKIDADQIRVVDRLIKLGVSTTAALNNLARAMRLSQNARMHREPAGRAAAGRPTGPKPWEDDGRSGA
jgi:hypothetical protein